MSGKPKHGYSRTRINQIWIDMRFRCRNPKSVNYKYYGGKGIRVCPEWDDPKSGFAVFLKWAIENGYSDNLEIDRIDADGNYEPSNCKWSNHHQQNVHLSKPPGKSGFYGVSQCSNYQKWYGRAKQYGKTLYTGIANSPLEAAILREKYILEHGLDNRLNGVI